MTARRCAGRTKYVNPFTRELDRCTRRTTNRIDGVPLCYQHDGKAEARRARARACVAACEGLNPEAIRAAVALLQEIAERPTTSNGACGREYKVKARAAVDALMEADHE